jgi:Short C-terminal domain
VGLFKRKDERAMPDPGTPEFEAMVEGSAIPDAQSVSMGESGWASTSSAEVEGARQSTDQRGTENPDQIRKAIGSILGQVFQQVPNAGGFGGGVSTPKPDPDAVVEQLAKMRDAGEITEAEFEAQKRRILGER